MVDDILLRVENREQGEVLIRSLESGELRAARQDASGEWHVDQRVKQAILRLFRVSQNVSLTSGVFSFTDRDLLIPSDQPVEGVRVVPGGTAIRRGAHLAAGVVVMPPAYVNIGAYVGPGTMIDSHVLVGSCAQIGARVHLSAGTQIGGVLEPAGALPVIVEDDAFIGGNCGIYEGVRVARGAVLAAGVILTASKPLYDLVHKCRIMPENNILVVPANAVVVAGSRAVDSPYAHSLGLSTSVNLVLKYRDASTEGRVGIEELLRE